MFFFFLLKLDTNPFGQRVSTSYSVRMWCCIALNNLSAHHFVLFCIFWCYRLKRGRINAWFKHNTVSIYITIRPFFPWLPRCSPRLRPSSSHTHFHVTLTCQCAQNCQSLLKDLDAMRNSFNTGPCRSPYHCCNGVLMPPCIPRACTRQLVIHLIYSTRPAVEQTAPCSCCVDGQNTRPDTQQASSFRGDLRVKWDSITGPEKTSFRLFYTHPAALLCCETNVGRLKVCVKVQNWGVTKTLFFSHF